MVSGYRDLDIYKLAVQVHDDLEVLFKDIPKLEEYGLKDQLRRSSASIIANIAEGYGRKYYKNDYLRFLTYARGSCDETREHILMSKQRNYASNYNYTKLLDEVDHLGKMLTQFIKSVSGRSN